MARMVRKQVYIDDELDRELVSRARTLGVTQAELVRRAVARYLQEERPTARQQALAELHELWDECKRLGVSSGGRKWTREELYGDRGAR